MNVENMRKWIAALRSGEFRQASGALYNHKADGYCCLGVACEIAVREGVISPKYFDAARQDYRYDGHWADLPEAVSEWLGGNEDFDPNEDAFSTSIGALPLAVLNDNKGFDFLQIADVLEASLNSYLEKNSEA